MIDLSRFRDRVDRAGAHPNGPIVLIRNRDDGGEDRLHWWTEDHNKWSNRHNHRWSFRSSCVYGELEEEFINVTGGSGGFRNDIDGTFLDLGPVTWEVESTKKTTPGPSRYLNLDQFHRVRALKETITWVQTEPMSRTWSRILPDLPEDDTNYGKFVSYDMHEAVWTLKEIKSILQ